MFKKIVLAVAVIACFSSQVRAEEATEQDAIDIVNKAIALIEEKGDAALEVINSGEGDFYQKDKSLYAFVYDETATIIAHPYKPQLVGRSYRGKPDVRGKKFRDEIVDNAMENGDTWTEYSYQKPGETGIHKKKAYSKHLEKDGKHYIVAAGIYVK